MGKLSAVLMAAGLPEAHTAILKRHKNAVNIPTFGSINNYCHTSLQMNITNAKPFPAPAPAGQGVTIWLWIPWATRPWNQAAWGSEGLFYSLVHYSISYPLRGPIIHFPLLFHCSWPKQFNARALIVLIPLFHCSAFPLFRGPCTDSMWPLKYSMDTCRFLRTKILCTCL